MKPNRKLTALTVTILLLSLTVAAGAQRSASDHPDHHDVLGPRFEATYDEPRHKPRRGEDLVRRWNELALNANALDHTPVGPGENRVFAEQLGPNRTARAFAIVHIVIFDAVNAITGRYRNYAGLRRVSRDASMDAAVAQAAHDSLVALYPSQRASFASTCPGKLRVCGRVRRGEALG